MQGSGINNEDNAEKQRYLLYGLFVYLFMYTASQGGEAQGEVLVSSPW